MNKKSEEIGTVAVMTQKLTKICKLKSLMKGNLLKISRIVIQ